MIKYKITKHTLNFSYVEQLVIKDTVKRFREFLNSDAWQETMREHVRNNNGFLHLQ
jgi:negative regulator of replication initiation